MLAAAAMSADMLMPRYAMLPSPLFRYGEQRYATRDISMSLRCRALLLPFTGATYVDADDYLPLSRVAMCIRRQLITLRRQRCFDAMLLMLPLHYAPPDRLIATTPRRHCRRPPLTATPYRCRPSSRLSPLMPATIQRYYIATPRQLMFTAPYAISHSLPMPS